MIPTVVTSDWVAMLLPNIAIFPTFADDRTDRSGDELGALWVDLGGSD